MLPIPERTFIPTGGELRIARAHAERVLGPSLVRLRPGLFFGLGVADLTLRLAGCLIRPEGRERAVRRVIEVGERRFARLSGQPRVRAVLDEVNRTVTVDLEEALDEAHDTVEELFGMIDYRSTAVAEGARSTTRRAVDAVTPVPLRRGA